MQEVCKMHARRVGVGIRVGVRGEEAPAGAHTKCVELRDMHGQDRRTCSNLLACTFSGASTRTGRCRPRGTAGKRARRREDPTSRWIGDRKNSKMPSSPCTSGAGLCFPPCRGRGSMLEQNTAPLRILLSTGNNHKPSRYSLRHSHLTPQATFDREAWMSPSQRHLLRRGVSSQALTIIDGCCKTADVLGSHR